MGCPCGSLPRKGKRATADNIVEAMRTRDVNALYLVCHGMLDESGPVLFLENERGNVDRVDGADLAETDRRPQATCSDAGRSGFVPVRGPDDQAPAVPETTDTSEFAEAAAESAKSLTAFGPALSRAGCAVVVAMQGNISMDTAAKFMPKFFKELRPGRHCGTRDGGSSLVHQRRAGLVRAGALLAAQARQCMVPPEVRPPGGHPFREPAHAYCRAELHAYCGVGPGG